MVLEKNIVGNECQFVKKQLGDVGYRVAVVRK